MKKYVGIFLFLFMTMYLSGTVQEVPALVSKLRGTKKPLELQTLDIDVKVSGFISETRMTMTFYNPHNRELVGDLHFPLPEGAFVSGYALDINGKMVDGVVVEKTKGRVVFDQIVRRGVDPGLVEWVKGNNFKTSVYPIFSKKSRKVMVRFVSQLNIRNGKRYYFLPLKYNIKVKSFSLKVALNASENPKEKSAAEKDATSLSVSQWKQQQVAQVNKKDFLLNNDINIPLPKDNTNNLAVEANGDGEYYFCYKDLNPLKEIKMKGSTIRPKRITVLWDTSKSRYGAKNDRKQELTFLERYLKGLADKRVRIDLFGFNIFKHNIGRFEIRNGDSSDVIRAIKELTDDGGTDMSIISPAGNERKPDLYLLFSDGNHSFGKEMPGAFDAPLVVLSASTAANHSMLRYVASSTGGRYINLNHTSMSHALAMTGRPSYTLLSVAAPKGALRETYPHTGSVINGEFTFTGKLLKKHARVTLNFGYQGRIVKRIKISLSTKSAISGHTLRTFWAQKKMEALTVFSKTNWQELIDHGKMYGLVTPGTSLIVLERLDDYLRYRIRPPDSLPDMQKEWDSDIGHSSYFNLEAEMKKAEKEDLDDIVEDWEDLVKWWQKKFPLPSAKKAAKTPSSSPGTVSATPPDGQSREQMTEEERQRLTEGSDRGPVDFNAQRDILSSGTDENGPPGTASVQGKIMLTDGSEIPGASVTATSPALNGQRSTISNEHGRYRFVGLPAGNYDIKFELAGFKTCTWKDIPLANGQSIRLRPIIMSPSALREEVVVCGASPVIERSDSVAGVAIQAWDPDTPYMKKIKAAKKSSKYRQYLKQREEYGNAPGFYLDCANYFFKQDDNQKDTGLMILSNLAELELDDPSMRRILAYRLLQLNYLEESERIFEIVKALCIEEPQSYRDLALVRERLGKFKSAANLLYKVALIQWDSRFDGINTVALVELNHVLASARKKGIDINKWGIDKRLIKLLDVDIRIIMTWDSDSADMDLWVIEPGGEKCYYSNNLTKIGGRLSDDFTGGLGPEEYMIHRAMPGKYIIKANYFGSGWDDRMSAPVTVQVDVYTNYGRKNEKRQSLTLRLANHSDVYTIGDIEFKLK